MKTINTIKIMLVPIMLAACLLAGCGKDKGDEKTKDRGAQKSKAIRSYEKLTKRDKRLIFSVEEAMLLMGAGETRNFKEFAKSIFQQIEQYYGLESGDSKLIYMEGKAKKWQLSMGNRLEVFTKLDDMPSRTVADVEKVLRETVDLNKYGTSPEEEAKAINKLVEDLKRGNDASARYDSIGGLIEFGGSAVEPLIEALKDKNPYVRGFAAYGLGKMGDNRAVRTLIEMLDDDEIFDFGIHPPLFVAHAAVEALANLKDTSAIPHLERALSIARNKAKKKYWEWDSLEKCVANDAFIKALQSAISVLGRAETKAIAKTQPITSSVVALPSALKEAIKKVS